MFPFLLAALRAHFSTAYASHNSFSAKYFVYACSRYKIVRWNFSSVSMRAKERVYSQQYTINRRRFFLCRLLKVVFVFFDFCSPLVCLFLHFWLFSPVRARVCVCIYVLTQCVCGGFSAIFFLLLRCYLAIFPSLSAFSCTSFRRNGRWNCTDFTI